MSTFTDSAGRTWTIKVDVGTIRRVRAVASVDLLEALNDPAFITRLGAGGLFVGDLLWHVVKPEADTRGIDRAAFEAGLTAPDLVVAGTALMAALVDFLRVGPKQDGTLIRLAVRKEFAALMELHLGGGATIGLSAVPDADAILDRIRDLAATLYMAESPDQATILFDIEEAERRLLAARQAARRTHWFKRTALPSAPSEP